MKTRRIAKLLIAAGIPVQSVALRTAEMDGEILITPRISVQVGSSYALVSTMTGNESRPDTIAFRDGPVRTKAEDIIRDVRRVLAKASN